MITRPRATGAAVALVMSLAACGDTDSSAPPTSVPPAPTTQPAGPDPDPGDPTPTTVAPVGTSPLPVVDVLDVATGETVALAERLPADRPLLVWFWAPH
ncbi:MAG TPA: hypothetical protein VFZ83_16405 [Acidimicrobiia bacterium]|nr:hypothetical protein [Acidimicrobiia bacterium]